MGNMTWDWARLATAIKDRRAALGLTQKELAERVGVTPTTIRNLEGGREFSRLPPSIRPLEIALGWAPGSVRSVLEGGEPALLESDLPAVAAPPTVPSWLTPLAERIPTTTIHELENGEVFATDVYDLSKDGQVRLYVIGIRDKDGPKDHEKLEREVQAWRQRQRELRALTPIDTGPDAEEPE